MPVSMHGIVKKFEHHGERDNHSCARRVVTAGKNLKTNQRRVRIVQRMKKVPPRRNADIAVPVHLQDLVEQSCQGWDDSQQAAIKELLVKHQDVFNKDQYDMEQTHLIEHPTTDDVPVAQPPRRFALAFPNYSKEALPLIGLTKKDVDFVWSEKQQIAFDHLKDQLRQAPIMALPCDTDGYILDTDAPQDTIGAVLSQMQDG